MSSDPLWRRVARRLVGSRSTADLDQLRLRIGALEAAVVHLASSPRYDHARRLGFNAQSFRQRMFEELLARFEFEAVIETGTWTGNAAAYMALESKLPVYTCDSNEIFHAVAKMRVQDIAGVVPTLADSRAFLTGLAGGPLRGKRCFIYLDAHWHGDLPLAEEIAIIAGNWTEYVIMIDDFEVPGDAGYGFDDYGEGRALTMRDFGQVFERHALVPFFPAARSDAESGHRRGSVVLAPRGPQAERLAGCTSVVGPVPTR